MGNGLMKLAEAVAQDEVEIINNLNDMARRGESIDLRWYDGDDGWECIWTYHDRIYVGFGKSIGVAIMRAKHKAPPPDADGKEESDG